MEIKMKLRKIAAALLSLTLLAGAVALTSCEKTGDDGDKQYKVGICQLAPHPALDAATKGFMEELKAQFGDNITFTESNAQGQNDACGNIISVFTSQKVDLILANATAALQAAANGTETIPVLGTSITEYGVALGIENFSGTVGTNVSGTSDLAPLDQQAKMVKDLFPDAKKVGLLYCSSEANSDYQVKVMETELTKLGFTCEKFPFTDSNDVTSVATAAAACDVIYIPTDNTAANCTETILGAIGDTPVVAGESGICSGCGVATLSIDYYELGVTTGKMAAKILKGEAKVEEMAIEYAPKAQKMYNEARCKELNIDIEALKTAGYTVIEGTEAAE